MRIKKIEITDFKGIKSKVYDVDSNVVVVTGKNGSGKTTIETAYFWVFADCDSSLKKNPNVVPIGDGEYTPRVDIVLDINGIEVTVAKIQKITKKKTGEVSISNSYEVNSIEHGLRDFKEKMSEYGFDFDNFLALSHPDVFTSQKSDEMRKILFKMCDGLSDKEIAKKTDGVSEKVADMFANYSFDEIKAMQSATIRKVKENYGKDGEILNAKISGLETAKVDYDGSVLEMQKKSLEEQIASCGKSKISNLEKEKFQLEFDKNEVVRKANESLHKERYEIDEVIRNLNSVVRDMQNREIINNQTLNFNREKLHNVENKVENLRNEYRTQKAMVFDDSIWEFDDSQTFCKACGQKLPQDKITELIENNTSNREKAKKDFDERQKMLLDRIAVDGKNATHERDDLKEQIEILAKDITENKSKIDEKNREISSWKVKLDSLPESVDMTGNKEYEEIVSRINSIDEEISKLKESSIDTFALESELDEVNKKITLLVNNSSIDEQISKLRVQQSEYEQMMADAENILYQLDLVSKHKNELLTESINRRFKMVEFKLFDYYKNGEYKECCIATIKGKDLSVSTNTALEVLMKLDIANSLQKFFEQKYPIWLDNAECLDDFSKKTIDSDTQLVFLGVSNEDLKVGVM